MLAPYASGAWSILLEVPLLRLAKRLDAVLLGPGLVIIIEFKTGAGSFAAPDRLQTERYGQSLRDFHEVSQSRLIVPILCAELAPKAPVRLSFTDGVADLMLANAATLGEALGLAAAQTDPAAVSVDAAAFALSPYRPTPTIVEAAQALYAGHQIADIGRGDAADTELQAAGSRLQQIAADAEAKRAKVICFVTGAPGAGKTLLGLDLALRSRSGTRPAALLSGNRPLVHVLTESLAADHAKRTGEAKAKARYEADAAIQNLLAYLKEHTDGAPPPEHVIVFDEAQRAWDEDVGQELMGRPNSEPELFLNILDRLDWACLVCLVGPGQEINRGEGGLPLWGEALARAAQAGRSWTIVAAPQALDGGPDVAGPGLLSANKIQPDLVQREPRLHLANAIRAYRNPMHGRWVATLLNGDIAAARALADAMPEPPAYLTRYLDVAKEWLRQRRRGGRSVGLLTSSGAVRLIGDGVPPAPRSNELGPIGHWFLKPWTDFRSSGALETPMSEFGCQGLELDYVGLCWGGDLIWSGSAWTPRMMRAPRWQMVHAADKQRFRLNGYRVLLTRGRAGSILYVPRGDQNDPTRPPHEAEAVAQILLAAGCAPV
ncbi:DNA/RNA helicase domain-containing protein [Brevundimonas sp. 374]|uniref:DNA/RNA helicase domain-containing protein n=1 Tax=Brevundimonas sp. 374 TaxID=1150400 RepID=UPI00115FB4A6|nr:DNA/RNA helicase domain-containing protein [Brevundimonas sp. 374]